jgi:hypothetical protein
VLQLANDQSLMFFGLFTGTAARDHGCHKNRLVAAVLFVGTVTALAQVSSGGTNAAQQNAVSNPPHEGPPRDAPKSGQ